MSKNYQNNGMSKYEASKYAEQNKYFNIFLKVSMGSSIAILISVFLSFFGIVTLPIFLGIVAIIVPSVFISATKLSKNMDKNFERHMYEADMLRKYMREAITKEHKVDQNTAYFMHEIKEANINMTLDNYQNLNQLIYLINQNYYEKICSITPNLSRHELVLKVLEQVSIYLETHDLEGTTFDYEDAESIINACFFIPDALKREILNDFSKARVDIGARISFVVKPVDDSFKRESAEEYLNSREYRLSRFDINDITSYEALMSVFKNHEKNPYKDAFLVEWDLEAIRDVMSLIVRRFGLIIEKRDNELYHYEMATTFFYNLCAYASVNKSESVGIKEIINTFKNWDYFDHNLKMDIVDAIFEEFDLDYSMHPYRKNKKNKEVGKVYNFFSKKENKK